MSKKKRSPRKPKRDGKALEDFVAGIEDLAKPKGWTVEKRRRIHGTKKQRVEFDIVVTGKAGTGEFKWLIECRDRPSHGAAPGQWILELSGKRPAYGFNKVTAVSTTGFSEEAVALAAKFDVELRTVTPKAPEDFSWIKGAEFVSQTRGAHLTRMELRFKEITPEVRASITAISLNSPVLRCSVTGQVLAPHHAFLRAVMEADEEEKYFDKLEVGGSRKVEITVKYSPETHYTVEGPKGSMAIPEILFEGLLTKCVQPNPLHKASQYEAADGTIISQSCIYQVQAISNVSTVLEFHRISETGGIHILLREVSES